MLVPVILRGEGGEITLEDSPDAPLVNLLPVLRGESGATARRHAYTAPHDYCATAPANTLDSVAGWSITRIAVAANGSTTVAQAAGAWTDRASLTYT